MGSATPFLLLFWIIYYIIILGILVLSIVDLWIIFEKAGEKGWAALIPFYNQYVAFKIGGKEKLFWWNLGVTCLAIAGYMFALIFWVLTFVSGIGSGATVLVTIVGVIIAICCLIASVVFKIFMYIGLAEAFNLGGGFTVGLIFIPIVFLSIMAFSKKIQYKNRQMGVPPYWIPPQGPQFR